MSLVQFDKEKKFVLELIRKLKPRRNVAHVSITFFALHIIHYLNFTSSQDLSTIEKVIGNFSCEDPFEPNEEQICNRLGAFSTRTHWALQSVNDFIFNEANGMRPDIPKNIVVVTDGLCTCPPERAEEELGKLSRLFEERDIRVVAVGILQKTDNETETEINFKKLQKNLEFMTWTPDDTHMVDDFEKLDKKFIERLSYCSGNQFLRSYTVKFLYS